MMPITKSLDAEGFHLEWDHENDQVNISLSAPSKGWVAIGFTEGNSIVDTNLIQGCVMNGKVMIQDQFVTGFGEHPPVEALAVPSRIFNLSGEEKHGTTTISFSIYSNTLDKLHYDLTEGKEINIWLAYSVSDDFDHHSRKRIMKKIRL
ncbi:MAG: DOMON domain-containing protein [Bacteroidota bacterium]